MGIPKFGEAVDVTLLPPHQTCRQEGSLQTKANMSTTIGCFRAVRESRKSKAFSKNLKLLFIQRTGWDLNFQRFNWLLKINISLKKAGLDDGYLPQIQPLQGWSYGSKTCAEYRPLGHQEDDGQGEGGGGKERLVTLG